jgi:4-hydroxy-tetrahydrodipicolinate synthase
VVLTRAAPHEVGGACGNERLAPLVNVFYAPPFADMHNRMKEALVILGRIPSAHVRPPLTPVSDDERHRIRLALRESGLV